MNNKDKKRKQSFIIVKISAKHDLFTKIKNGILDPTKCSINYQKSGAKVDRTEQMALISGKKKANAL